jgi:hypothetical protein
VQNKMKTWLKGFNIGLFVVIILAISLFIFQPLTCSTNWGTWQKPFSNYCYILFPINGTMSGFSGILNLLLYPVIGTLIGWIIGKSKK